MWWLATGLLAAAVSWPINSWLIMRCFPSGRVWVSPVMEEALKTGLALCAGAPVVLSHAVFGTVEALYEVWREKKAAAGGAAFVSHLMLGIITVELYRWWGGWLPAALGAAVVHTAWNGLVYYIFP